MSRLKYLKQFDQTQYWRLFVDGRFQKKYDGWVGYEAGERGSIQALLNGFSFMIDNFDISGDLKKSYIDCVFRDSKQMFDHMYTDTNTKKENKDYIGEFYYNYGDHVYHDVSRCEGIVGAYYLAEYLGNQKKSLWIMQNMLLSAKGLIKTFHDIKSVYAHIEPKRALNSFMFKLTRQWIRVDSVQYIVCFYARLYNKYIKINGRKYE